MTSLALLLLFQRSPNYAQKVTFHISPSHSYLTLATPPPGSARAETSTRVKAREGYNSEGVSGLRALGVRDLPYRLSFLACSVQDTKPGVGLVSVADKVWGMSL